MECYQEFQDLYRNFHDEHLKQLTMGLMMAKNKTFFFFLVIKTHYFKVNTS